MQFLEEHLPHPARDRGSRAAPDGIYQLLKMQPKDMIFQSKIESSELRNLLFFQSRVESTIGFPHLPERERYFHFYREGQFESLVSGRKERRGRGGVWVDWRGLALLGGSPAWGLLLSPDPGFFLPQNLRSPRKIRTSDEKPARIIVRAAQRSRNQWKAFPL